MMEVAEVRRIHVCYHPEMVIDREQLWWRMCLMAGEVVELTYELDPEVPHGKFLHYDLEAIDELTEDLETHLRAIAPDGRPWWRQVWDITRINWAVWRITVREAWESRT